MNKPSGIIVELVAPSHDVDGLAISDGFSLRNVAHAETRDTLRLPRGGAHEATLVAVKRYYDGSNGGEAGHYLMVWVEFRAAGSRWRTAGVKVRAEEAPRIVRDMTKGKASKPGRNEDPRVGGKTVANDESELHGAPVKDSFLLFVRHKNRAGEWVRTRGCEVLESERPIVANMLRELAARAAE
jgi:hypothetical protein